MILDLLRGERIGVEGNYSLLLSFYNALCLLRGERIGVEGNGIIKSLLWVFSKLAKGRKDWGGRKPLED